MTNKGYVLIEAMTKGFGISVPTAFALWHKTFLFRPVSDCRFAGEIDDLWGKYDPTGKKNPKHQLSSESIDCEKQQHMLTNIIF